MGKKTTGRLAGLAALAAAAYMANKGKGESASGPTVTPTPEIAPAPAPAAKKADDITVSGEGGFDTPANMNSISRVGTPARVASSVKNPVAKPPAAKPYVPFSRTQVTPDAKREAEQEKLMSAYKPRRPDTKLKDTKFTTKSGNKTITTTPYADEELKRGGRVKKMASGGMTSKRGDGIASKGKTRCKIC